MTLDAVKGMHVSSLLYVHCKDLHLYYILKKGRKKMHFGFKFTLFKGLDRKGCCVNRIQYFPLHFPSISCMKILFVCEMSWEMSRTFADKQIY